MNRRAFLAAACLVPPLARHLGAPIGPVFHGIDLGRIEDDYIERLCYLFTPSEVLVCNLGPRTVYLDLDEQVQKIQARRGLQALSDHVDRTFDRRGLP